MKKVIKVFMVSVALISVFALCSFNASADKLPAYFDSISGGVYLGASAENYVTKLWKWSNSSVSPYETLISCAYTDTSTNTQVYGGFRVILTNQGWADVPSGSYFDYEISILGYTDHNAAIAGFPRPIEVYIASQDGTIYELESVVTYNSTKRAYELICGGRVPADEDLTVCTLVIDALGFYSPNQGKSQYQLHATNTLTVTKSAEQVRHEELLGTIEEVRDDILYGWETDSNLTDIMDDINDELSEAEEGVFGGMTEEEAQGKIDDALDIGGMPDPNGGGSIAVMRFFKSYY